MRRFTWMICALILVGSAAAQSGPPALCKPCLFYGGDLDETDVNSTIFYNENTITYPMTSTYGAITVPLGRALLVEGILFQVMQVTAPNPKEVSWDVRTDVAQGGGKSIGSGQALVTMQPTGRIFDQYSEYSMAVKLNPPVYIVGNNPSGTKYWFNMTPMCLKKTPACRGDQWFVSNTTKQANNFRGVAEPRGWIFINSGYYGYTWQDWCSLRPNGSQCGWLSFGLMGKIVQ